MFGLFGDSSLKAIESVATEWIETSKERAEAQAVMIKALDPNGKMRRDIARVIGSLFLLYFCLMVLLILCQSLNISPVVIIAEQKVRSVDVAVDSLKELFVPIVSLYGTITTASFGVNALNAYKGK